MKPVVALVGRPNVGKSTLFNRLTKSRDALVADIPGLTRDRHYGHGRLGSKAYLVIDTGGFEPDAKSGIVSEMARQAEQAIAEADVVIFLTDGRAGVTGHDHTIAEMLRKAGRRVLLAVNKTEGMTTSGVANEFYELGLGAPYAISSAHGDGVRELLELALEPFPEPPEEAEEVARRPRVAIAGRPNVGKSTLVNALLGEERVIAFDQPGTTRDAISIDFDWHGKPYTLIDTAGLRKRGKVFETIEKFSVVKTIQAIEDANIVILVLDARQDIADQDAHIAGFILESGRALVVAVNKWDGLDSYVRERIKQDVARKLQFLSFANLHFISAREAQGIGGMMKSVGEAYGAATAKLSTPRITRALMDAVSRQQPPRAGVSRPKMRYAHQGGTNPPIIVVHGNALQQIPDSYKRYLEGYFRETFKLKGTPLRVQFKHGANPYADK
jgi:GTPase